MPKATGNRKTLKLLAVGDILLGDSATSFGFGVGSMIARHGPTFPFRHVGHILTQADLVIGNLEAVLSAHDRGREPFERVQFRGQPEAAQGLKAAGIHVLSMATNHTMQHGKPAVVETVRSLYAQGIQTFGVELPDLGATGVLIVQRGDTRIGLINYNLRPQQYFVDAPLWREPTSAVMRDAVSSLRKEADIAAVSLHWGDEFIHYPSPDQVQLAHALVDAGAQLVMGHHPHIVQGIERYKHGIIAYSLGNFVFDMWQPRLRQSLVFECLFEADKLIAHDVIPVYINSSWQPVPMEEDEAERERRRIEELETRIGADPRAITRYRSDVAEATRRYRREVHRHYLTNLHRYPPKHLWQNFRGAMMRRMR